MSKSLERKTVLKGKYENIIQENDHYYIVDNFYKICVLPYTISTNGILGEVGVIKEFNPIDNIESYSLISGYINSDDPTNLVAANRILYEIIGSNVKNADEWMYLGKIDNISSGSKLIIYCVNITDVEINESEEVEENKKAKKFEMINSNKVVSSDDALFLASYLRLFNYFYVKNLK